MATITHGHCEGNTRSRTYNSWRAMKARCYEKKNVKYPRYGGRGIRVTRKWRRSFKSFLDDMGPRPDGHTIDRKDNEGDYTPDNCVWATAESQNRNKGDTVLDKETAADIRAAYQSGARVCDLARKYGIEYQTCHAAATGKTWT